MSLKLIEREGFWVREAYQEQDLVIVRDIYQNDAYKLRLPGVLERVRNAQLIVDVGAHIGCFAKLVHEINPSALIECIECEPRNWEALEANVGEFATIYRKACTYDPRLLELYSAFTLHGCESTGRGCVIPLDAIPLSHERYMPAGEIRAEDKITLEEIRDSLDGMQIDLLKLDCEGAEFSILANCELEGIAFIVGEYHGRREWDCLREWRMPHWDYGHMSMSGNLGNFHLRNPAC